MRATTTTSSLPAGYVRQPTGASRAGLARRIQLSPRTSLLLGRWLPGDWKRKALEPEAFRVSSDVRTERVLLLEDSWATGSTPLSAAIAVRRAGAATLALVSIARMVYEDAMTDEYDDAASTPIDFARFPR